MTQGRYEGRPGLAPAVATLIADGRITKRDRILDVGCGKGTDALLLAKWGFAKVTGIDPDAGAIAIARRRASRLAAPPTFQAWDAEELPRRVRAGSFDAVLHTLVANNLKKRFDDHFAGIAHALKRGGLLVLTMRTVAKEENAAPGVVKPVKGLEKHFVVSPGVSFQMAEKGDYAPPYARVAGWIGRR